MDDQLVEPPPFGGKPGEAVPEVDPGDVKTVWQMGRDLQANLPGQRVSIDFGVLKAACKPGANIEAAWFRASVISVIDHVPLPQCAELTKDGYSEAIFRVAAKIPMEWIGPRPGTRQPFNLAEFLRLCEQQQETGT